MGEWGQVDGRWLRLRCVLMRQQPLAEAPIHQLRRWREHLHERLGALAAWLWRPDTILALLVAALVLLPVEIGRAHV